MMRFINLLGLVAVVLIYQSCPTTSQTVTPTQPSTPSVRITNRSEEILAFEVKEGPIGATFSVLEKSDVLINAIYEVENAGSLTTTTTWSFNGSPIQSIFIFVGSIGDEPYRTSVFTLGAMTGFIHRAVNSLNEILEFSQVPVQTNSTVEFLITLGDGTSDAATSRLTVSTTAPSPTTPTTPSPETPTTPSPETPTTPSPETPTTPSPETPTPGNSEQRIISIQTDTSSPTSIMVSWSLLRSQTVNSNETFSVYYSTGGVELLAGITNSLTYNITGLTPNYNYAIIIEVTYLFLVSSQIQTFSLQTSHFLKDVSTPNTVQGCSTSKTAEDSLTEAKTQPILNSTPNTVASSSNFQFIPQIYYTVVSFGILYFLTVILFICFLSIIICYFKKALRKHQNLYISEKGTKHSGAC